jgi:AcrR family transcriptional regulator
MVRTRLTAQERHVQLVEAAVTAFAQGGYAGTTTDQVARIAGVSQPYVIRLFGSKQDLFLATVRHAGDRVQQIWREAAAEDPTLSGLGKAYKQLLAERDLLVVLLHGFAAASDPGLGDAVRQCYGDQFTLVRELTGASAEEVRDFFAHGMLITVLGAMRVLGPDAVAPQPWVTEILSTLPSSEDD